MVYLKVAGSIEWGYPTQTQPSCSSLFVGYIEALRGVSSPFGGGPLPWHCVPSAGETGGMMTGKDGPVEPYSTETAANTHAPWVSDDPLKVDVTGLRDYAKDMLDQQLDLASRSAHLTHLAKMPHDAWQGSVLGEAAFIRAQLMGNAAELTSYLSNLSQTLFNIGSAAQTIADIYGSSDAISATELSDVLFAFGDKHVPRPAGLPSNVGQTYEEALAAGSKEVPPAQEGSAEWGTPTTTSSPYQTTQTSFNATTGQTREVVTTSVPGSGMTVVTTTVYNRSHQVVSTSSTRTSTHYDVDTNQQVKVVETGPSTTTTTTTYDDGKVTHEDSRSTTTVDGKSESTGHREVKIDPVTGARTETTYNAKGEITDQVVIGAETDGQLGVEKPISEQYDPTLNGGLHP